MIGPLQGFGGLAGLLGQNPALLQQPNGLAGLAQLFMPPSVPAMPQPPSPVTSFGGLPPELQREVRRQQMLSLAQLIGAAQPGQIGTAIASAGAQNDPMRRGYMELFNQQQQQRFQQEQQQAAMQAQQEQQQRQAMMQEQVAQGAMGLAGELVKQYPEQAGEIRGILLSSAGDPSRAMEALAEWRQARQVADQRQAAMEAMGIPPEYGALPSGVQSEAMKEKMGLGQGDPRLLSGENAIYIEGQGWVPNPYAERQQPPAPAAPPKLQIDWRTGQVFNPETGEIGGPPPGYTPPPKDGKTDWGALLGDADEAPTGRTAGIKRVMAPTPRYSPEDVQPSLATLGAPVTRVGAQAASPVTAPTADVGMVLSQAEAEGIAVAPEAQQMIAELLSGGTEVATILAMLREAAE